ncbi:MAG: phenylacetate--CoA ligase family protein [Peptococcaceae bacterium]|nr:MAG: phenylacetate--CoA ligase family protein [Peptococcaceae bacterium]
MYRELRQNQWKTYEELRQEQEKQLRRIISFAYENVPYYRKLFNALRIIPGDIKGIKDLEGLPILTKEIIKQNRADFRPVNLKKIKYYESATGGSTGTPFKYRLERFDKFLSAALLYRGWGYGGYELGDRTVLLANAALSPGVKSKLAVITQEIARNIRKLSAFDMDDKGIKSYIKVMNSFKPKFIRGCASSIYFFARWIAKNRPALHQPVAVFTTAEKLYPVMREMIKDAFKCNVYDTYGLNDGGVSAFECPDYSGLHIDTERSVMEVVDENGEQLENGEGKILATSLYNYAMPFIRYDTGDLGRITINTCRCGRGYKLLQEVIGRNFDILVTPEGKGIHGCFFTNTILEYCPGIKEYQVVQERLDRIVVKIFPEEDFKENQLDKVKEVIRKRSKGWQVEFEFVDKIDRTSSGKYQFIINKSREGNMYEAIERNNRE